LLRPRNWRSRGNPTEDLVNGITNWGGEFDFVVKDDGSADPYTGSFGGYTFSLSSSQALFGSWTLTLSPTTGLPIYLDLVVTLKAAEGGFAAYLFEDEGIFATNNGAYTMTIVNNGSQIAELSGLSIFARAGEAPGNGDTPGNGQIPEPGMLGLLGVGLLGQAWLLRRRQQQK
jgi:hypothetical protein